MNNPERICQTVEDFLEKEKKKVLQERKILEELLSQLVEQQVSIFLIHHIF